MSWTATPPMITTAETTDVSVMKSPTTLHLGVSRLLKRAELPIALGTIGDMLVTGIFDRPLASR